MQDELHLQNVLRPETVHDCDDGSGVHAINLNEEVRNSSELRTSSSMSLAFISFCIRISGKHHFHQVPRRRADICR
jgi:hypothetical protein